MKHYRQFCKGFEKAMEQGAKIYVLHEETKTLCKSARHVMNEINSTEYCMLGVILADGSKTGIVFVDQEPSDWGEKAEMIFDEYLNSDFE